MKFSQGALLAVLASAAATSATVIPIRRAAFTLQNGKDAIALNAQFATLNASSPCTAGQNACVQTQFAQCVNGAFVLQSCGAGLTCAALPLVNSAGTSITCTTTADRDARIAATGATDGSASSSASASASVISSSSVSAPSASVPPEAASTPASVSSSPVTSAAAPSATSNGTTTGNNGGNTTDSGAQSSLTLLPSVIATGFQNDGQSQPEAGQVPSLTSSNNFINFCATVPNLPITNGQQIKTGSCNPAPMGIIAASTNIPSAKFQFPTNGAVIPANQTFTIQFAINHLETGHFVNADSNYFSAPQQVNAAGDIQGHSHIVIEQLTSLTQTEPTNPTKFAFFKGLNDVAQNGILTANVTNGLAAGFYRLASINSAANHQPVLVAIAQRGSTDDMVYFNVV